MGNVKAVCSLHLVLEGASDSQMAHSDCAGHPLRASDSSPAWDSDFKVVLKLQEGSPTGVASLSHRDERDSGHRKSSPRG